MTVPVAGYCDRRFAGVRRAFSANFAERGELGAAVTVTVGGDTVVELVGGWARAHPRCPWQPDTLVDIYSAAKPFLALLVLALVDAGIVGLDDPVAELWPEFAEGGKAAATVRHALCHRAGVPAIRAPLDNDALWDWDRMVGALAATEAWWEPGTRHAYHANTYGHLVGEIVRRATGTMPGARLAAMAESVGADLHVGVSPGDLGRCADVVLASRTPGAGIDGSPLGAADDRRPRAAAQAGGDGGGAAGGSPAGAGEAERSMLALAYFNPPGYSSIGVENTERWRRAEVPSTNAHATATAIARVYAALLEEGRLLSPALLAEATSVQSEGYCPVLGEHATFGLGFTPTTVRRRFGPNPGSFGHFGTGGAVGFADPVAGVAFGYAMNHVIPRWQSTRNRALIDAVYEALAPTGASGGRRAGAAPP